MPHNKWASSFRFYSISFLLFIICISKGAVTAASAAIAAASTAMSTAASSLIFYILSH